MEAIIETSDRKTYTVPEILYEDDLEARAGSPLAPQEFNPVLGPEFQEIK